MNCNCAVCKDRNPEKAGILLAENEVLPFVKFHILKMKNIKKPIPIRYDGLLSSLFAYSQALNYDRVHNNSGRMYYTDNFWMLKFKDKLNDKFPEIIITDKSKMDSNTLAQEVCEFRPASI